MTDVKITRALLSVSDKSGLADLGKALARHGVELVSTGGTAKALREEGLDVLDVSDITGFPEMMDGRVKTLHPKVHGGLLAMRDNDEHVAAMSDHEIGAIDLVVVNLYPFADTVLRGAARAEAIENIDIGGPSMIRSAAKNHAHVAVVTDPEDYEKLVESLDETDGKTSHDFRRKLAEKAFSTTATYDAMISTWFSFVDQGDAFPDILQVPMKRQSKLRYGENPHQMGALYLPVGPGGEGVATAEQVQGKELSYNNLNDADAAYELICEFPADVPACAIIKHANPCGVAVGDTPMAAYQEALNCDTVSAFGGIVALNQPLTGDVAEAITEIFTEVVIAPDADADARAIFAKKKNLRLLLTGSLPIPDRPGMTMKTINGGILFQTRDYGVIKPDKLKIVTDREPTAEELSDCLFAWKVAKHVKSNAIVYAKNGVTAGVGAGQMNRLESARIAAWKAKDAAEKAGWEDVRTKGSAVASDAFFPFADGLMAAVEAGATAVIQPGGSIRDDEVIAAANEAGLAMVFTDMRHFRH